MNLRLVAVGIAGYIYSYVNIPFLSKFIQDELKKQEEIDFFNNWR
jgi:hypothetical protein|tara:strand:+ start:225 stop:359 length:135 start_codon:yes stop_codon:yes gene_type:complete